MLAQRLERLVGSAGETALRFPFLASVQDESIGRWGGQFRVQVTKVNRIGGSTSSSVEQNARRGGIGIADKMADRFSGSGEHLEVPSVRLGEAVVGDGNVVACRLFSCFEWNEEATAVRPGWCWRFGMN